MVAIASHPRFKSDRPIRRSAFDISRQAMPHKADCPMRRNGADPCRKLKWRATGAVAILRYGDSLQQSG
jgi:hypothetical protein